MPLARSIVSTGGAMGDGAGGNDVAGDVTCECAAGDADGVCAVVVVVWMIVHLFGWW